MFYDVMKLELPRGAFGGDKWIEKYYTLDTLDYLSIGANGNFPGTFLEDVNFRIPSNDPSCPECGAIDPDLKPMRQQELVFGLEHELSARMSLERPLRAQADRPRDRRRRRPRPVPRRGLLHRQPGEGTATHIVGPEFPSLPKVKRDYDAFELKLRKRFSNRWEADASYTLSRLYGNYPGLASSDEVARNAPNVTRLFDAIYMAFDDQARRSSAA